MGKPKAKPETVSHLPLFVWFDAEKKNRRKLRDAGYTDGRITNWKRRGGIPRGEIPAVAAIMGLKYDEYLAAAGETATTRLLTKPDGISDEALEIARAFDQMQPQTQERVREHVFIYSAIDTSFPWLRSGKPVGGSYEKFEKWHRDNMATNLALEAARIAKLKTVK